MVANQLFSQLYYIPVCWHGCTYPAVILCQLLFQPSLYLLSDSNGWSSLCKSDALKPTKRKRHMSRWRGSNSHPYAYKASAPPLSYIGIQEVGSVCPPSHSPLKRNLRTSRLSLPSTGIFLTTPLAVYHGFEPRLPRRQRGVLPLYQKTD